MLFHVETFSSQSEQVLNSFLVWAPLGIVLGLCESVDMTDTKLKVNHLGH